MIASELIVSLQKSKKKQQIPPLPSNNKLSLSPFESEKIHIEIIRVLTRSNFLTAQELGRLLLFVSKSLPKFLYCSKNELWQTLLIHRFGHDVTIFAKTVGAEEKLFRSLLKGQIKPDKASTTHPSNHKPCDYKLIVNVHPTGRSKACYSKVLEGQDILPFFKNGFLKIENINLALDEDESNVERNWYISIHILRKIDCKCCCLFQSVNCFAAGNYFSFSGNCCLKMKNGGGRLLDELIQSHHEIQNRYGYTFHYGIFFEVELRDIIHGCNYDGRTCGCSLKSDRVAQTCPTISSMQIELRLHNNLISVDYPKTTNIEFIQILDFLNGWDRH